MKERNKIHMANLDFGSGMFTLPTPAGKAAWYTITICGHMYDTGLSTRLLEEVTRKSCLRRLNVSVK